MAVAAPGQAPDLPSTPLAFGAFTATFSDNGTFVLQGEGWPAFRGTYKTGRDAAKAQTTIELLTPDAAGGCDKSATYAYTAHGSDDGHGRS